MVNLIVATSEYRDSQYVIMPKATLRTNWDSLFRGKLNEMNLLDDDVTGPFSGKRENRNHKSAIIRVIARSGALLSVGAKNIFFVTYLNKHSAAQGIKIPDKRNLGGLIEREIEKEPENTSNNDE